MTSAEGMPIARQIIRELYEKEFGPVRDNAGHETGGAEASDALSLPQSARTAPKNKTPPSAGGGGLKRVAMLARV